MLKLFANPMNWVLRRPCVIVNGEPDKPAVQENAIDVLHQLLLEPGGKQHLHEAGRQQPFGQNSRATCAGIRLLNVA